MENKLNTGLVKSNILKSIVFIFSGLLAMITVAILYTQNHNFKLYNDKFHDSIHKSIHHTLEHNKRYYKFLLQRLSQASNIKEYISKNDREKVYEILKPKFDLLQEENKYFETLHIIDPEGKSFLRVHKKEVYGDNLSEVRTTVKDIITSQKVISGYETGKHSTAFRTLSPMFYENKYIGSIGIGVNPNYFLEKIGEIINEKGMLFINEKDLKIYSTKSDFEIKNYKLQTKITDAELNILKHLPKDYNFEDNIKLAIGYNFYVLHTLSIEGFKGNNYAKYIFIQDITTEVNRQNKTRLFIILIIIIFIVIIFFVVRYFLNKLGDEVDTFYKDSIEKIEFNKKYLKAVEDNSSNIIVSSLAKKLFSANERFFEFSGFDSVESFNKKYKCICDLFINRDGYLSKEIDGVYWIEYIYSNPKKIHKAIMLRDGEEHIFKVTSSPLNIDKHNRCVATFVDITSMEELKDRYEIAINGSNDGLWDLDILTNKPYFSPRWKTMLGYRDDELSNSFTTWEDLIHPDDVAQAYIDIEKSLNSADEVYQNIHRLRHKDGHWVWILSRGKVIFDENGKAIRMVGFHTDVTKTKELEIKLKENQKIYFDFFENTKSANIIYETNDDGKTFIIKDLNHLVENLENIKREDIIDKNVEEVFKGIKEFGLLDIIKEVYKTGKPSKMPITQYKDKKISGWRENYIFKLSNGDIVASYEDRTKEKQLELDLRNQEEIMIAQSRHAAMSEMISMIAHQWRQPLSVISMGANNIMADIELDIVDNKTLKNGAIDILEQTQELSKTIDDFKNFFRPVKTVEKILPEDIFIEAFKVVGKSLENNEIEVIQEFNNGKKIETYSRELMQVFINIIKNAKEVLVDNEIKDRKIFIYIKDSSSKVEIKICDNAGGVPEGIIDKIFNPYFSTKDEKSGTGLGLYMSKTIVEKHLNGLISVDNENGGACFKIVLPYSIKKS
ncbi:MAG: PAS domain-containing protein [Campylobacterota bacterium]|nr:PAS domain-containing protein [Campylobacterota bacterium]